MQSFQNCSETFQTNHYGKTNKAIFDVDVDTRTNLPSEQFIGAVNLVFYDVYQLFITDDGEFCFFLGKHKFIKYGPIGWFDFQF